MSLAVSENKWLAVSEYKELTMRVDEEAATVWVSMHPVGRQCFTLSMLQELLVFCRTLDEYGSLDPEFPDTIRYAVLQSDHPDIYNTGGDLKYFSELVKQKNPELLREYGIACIDLVYWALTGGKRQITMIANVAGDAFGGGFEAALACRYIFSEERSNFSFPEALFGFFPGMGAFQLFQRSVGVLEAEKAFVTGKRYSAKELKQLGGIYSLVEEGEGEQKIKEFIEERERNRYAHHALQSIKQYNESITYESFVYSIDLWVNAAMKLTERNLRTMSILTRRQKKKGSVNIESTNPVKNNNPVKSNSLGSAASA